jgi:hypothetical protein
VQVAQQAEGLAMVLADLVLDVADAGRLDRELGQRPVAAGLDDRPAGRDDRCVDRSCGQRSNARCARGRARPGRRRRGRPPRSLRLDVGVPDELAPARELVVDGLAERLGVPPTPSLPWASSFSLMSGCWTTVLSALLSFSMIGFGVFAGTNIAYQDRPRSRRRRPPASSARPGTAALRLVVETASAFSLPAFTNCAAAGSRPRAAAPGRP